MGSWMGGWVDQIREICITCVSVPFSIDLSISLPNTTVFSMKTGHFCPLTVFSESLSSGLVHRDCSGSVHPRKDQGVRVRRRPSFPCYRSTDNSTQPANCRKTGEM